jgi:hypothetical protein
VSIPNLGRLERVDVRKAWSHEAQDFTPWLADNLDNLSSFLGIDLELEGTEVEVGSNRADIVARVPQTDDRVLIENQLELANLQHLGQVLAYLAGLEAKIVVWIAKGFKDEHLSAIRWLNEHTVAPFAFFAVQVSVVQIEDSQLAPVFEVLERPNEWNRQVQKLSQSGELSERGQFQQEFWAHCVARWKDGPELSPGYALPNLWHRKIRGPELKVVQYISSKGVGVYLGGKSQDEASALVETRIKPFRKALKEAIQGERFLGGSNPACKTVLNIDTRDQANWDQIADWLDEQRQKYEKILRSGSDAAG